MSSIGTTILEIWKGHAIWIISFFIIFSSLARLAPCNPGQPLWRKDSLTDVIYFFLMPIINRVAAVLFLSTGMFLLFHGAPWETVQGYLTHGYGLPSKLPIWQQAAIIFLAEDFFLYWMHRWFHTRKMWPFHAIHHSAEQVDWLTTYRFHPINSWLSFTLADSLMILMGFSPAAISAMAGFNMVYSAMVHANLNWTFGPFRFLFASPVFHRWHHTAQEEGMDKNFAPTIPLLDIVFGTFYMPDNRLPTRFGVPGSNIPRGFVGQIVWPFKRTKN